VDSKFRKFGGSVENLTVQISGNFGVVWTGPEQIYITNRYVTNTPPLPPSSLLHPIPPIVHPPPSSLPLLDVSSVTCW
jgi:hypothetical protein